MSRGGVLLGLCFLAASAAREIVPGAPEQVKLSLADPNEMVVSWISFDEVPTDGSCFAPNRPRPAGQVSSAFPYPISAECVLAPGEAEWTDTHSNATLRAHNASLLFADHDVDSSDAVSNTSTPRIIHIVRMGGLIPQTEYSYRVRSVGGNWSALHTFSTLPRDVSSRGLSLLITADVGAGGIPPAAVAEVGAAPPLYDMHLHAGDMAYDMSINHGRVGDQFFNELSAIASRIPFQAWPGNHETDDHFCDFLSFRARLSNQNLTGEASGSHNSRYYSFDIPGLLHVVGIDTDAYAEPDFNTPGNGYSGQSYFVAEQYAWLEQDLAAVNRSNTPWVFLMGHHPMYCSSAGEDVGQGLVQAYPKLACRALAEKRGQPSRMEPLEVAATKWCYDCDLGGTMIREGCTNGTVDPASSVPSCGVGTGNWEGKRWGLEPLMDRYGVDMYWTGHIHMYERSWPTLRGQVQKTYQNPTFPVHINTGNSGSRNDFYNGPPRDFTAFRLTHAGCYSSVKIHNATHLTFEQKHAGNGTVLDSFELWKKR